MRLIYCCAWLALSALSLPAQTIFVDADASGSADGTSWANAYTDLQTGLDNATAGSQVWVAAGTYLPPADTSFVVSTAISIIGGFAGTETNAEEADPAANPTTLSGDFNGDDDPGDLSANRSDNVQIMLVDSVVTDPVTIRNFNFVGGHLPETPEDDFIDFYSGGGIFSYAPLLASNLNFSECVADFGAAIAVYYEEAGGSVIDNINCTNNFVATHGMVYFRNTINGTVSNSTFDSNSGGRGGGVYGQNGGGHVVEGCTFSNNTVTSRGGAVGFVRVLDVGIFNCEFDNNTAESGGAIYVFHNQDATGEGLNAFIDSCTITNNSTEGRASGILNLGTNMLLTNTTLANNSCGPDGRGALHVITTFRELFCENVTFDGNQGTDIGAAVYLQNVSEYNFTNCSWENNGGLNSADDGAGITIFGDFDTLGINAVLNLDSCFFFNNQTMDDGGAIRAQPIHGDLDFNLSNSTFINNQANDLAGAIYLLDGVNANIENCEFVVNNAADGGAITYIQGLTDPEVPNETLGNLDISGSIFNGNQASEQGGAINFSGGVSGELVNNLFVGNAVTSEGAGGAFIVNGDSSIVTVVDVTNNTFYENLAVTVGDDIAAFLDPLDDGGESVTINLTNNVFASTSGNGNVGIEDGDPEFISHSGNYWLQDPGTVAVIGDFFGENADPLDLFVSDDFLIVNLQPAIGSPLIDNGVDSSYVPATDIAGLDRDFMPDIGAHELAFTTVAEIVVASDVHTQLETALGLAGLVDDLEGPGPFTVFAPDDAAFAEVDADLLALILLDIDGLLSPTLLYHVVPEIIYSREILNGDIESAVSLQGESLAFSEVDFETAFVNGATITQPDILARNGVVHVIDQVLLPIIISTEELADSGLDIDIFPNPVQNDLQVRIEEPGVEAVDIRLFDMNGRLLSEYQLGSGSHRLDLRNLIPGTYQLEIRVDQEVYRHSLLKQ